MPYVYVLQCGVRYYVGSTRGPIEEGLQAHWLGTGYGSLWAAKHRPTAVLSCIEVDGDPLPLERATTAANMLQHGWQSVRGPVWCKPEMKAPSWWDPEGRELERRYGPKRQASSPALGGRAVASALFDGPVSSPAVTLPPRDKKADEPDRFEAPVSPSLSPASSQAVEKEE